MRPGARAAVVGGVGLAALAALAAAGPIPQDPAYHDFADRRTWLGIPRAADVLSNLPFVAVGAWGLAWILRRGAAAFEVPWERAAFALHFLGQFLTGFGSAWYHWAPDGGRLVWDRMPLTLAITPLLAAVAGERIGPAWGRRLLAPLAAAGVASVILGHYGPRDLRLYAWIQFFPLVGIPLLLALGPARYTRGGDWIGAIAWYAAAKAFEMTDLRVFEALGGLVSGHTIKHLLAAMAGVWILRMAARREMKTGLPPPAGTLLSPP